MTLRLPTDECSIDTLAGVLLRFCRDHSVILRSIHDSSDELPIRARVHADVFACGANQRLEDAP